MYYYYYFFRISSSNKCNKCRLTRRTILQSCIVPRVAPVYMNIWITLAQKWQISRISARAKAESELPPKQRNKIGCRLLSYSSILFYLHYKRRVRLAKISRASFASQLRYEKATDGWNLERTKSELRLGPAPVTRRGRRRGRRRRSSFDPMGENGSKKEANCSCCS